MITLILIKLLAWKQYTSRIHTCPLHHHINSFVPIRVVCRTSAHKSTKTVQKFKQQLVLLNTNNPRILNSIPTLNYDNCTLVEKKKC